mgnify:FL=1
MLGLFSCLGFNPAQRGDIAFWYDPAGPYVTRNGSNRVSLWSDRSGTGDANKHAAQGAPGNQPLWTASDANLGGRPSLVLDNARADKLLTGTFAAPIAMPMTWLAVGYLSAFDSVAESIIVDGQSANKENAIYWGSGVESLYGNANLGGRTVSVPYAFVRVGVFNGAASRSYSNSITSRAVGNTGTPTLEALSIGTNLTGGAANYDYCGSVGDIIGCAGALSEADVAQLILWAGAKYSIPIETATAVMPLGDSITRGYNDDVYGGWRRRIMDAHPELVGRGTVNTPVGYRHQGISSATLVTINANISTYWVGQRSTEVWLTAGTADILNDAASAATCLTRLDTLLTTLEALPGPPTTIRVQTITPLLAPHDITVATYNAGIPAVVAGHPSAVYQDVGGRLNPSYLDVDNIHPNTAGHVLLASYWEDVL